MTRATPAGRAAGTPGSAGAPESAGTVLAETPPSGISAVSLGRRRLGESQLRVFPLAMGGNVFGVTADRDATVGILNRYSEFGGNFLDTADSYADGQSESMIGAWMRDRRNRAEMIVATKVGKSAENPGVTESAIGRAVTASLRRLQTDYIDLLYLHTDDANVPFEETLLAVDEQVRAGRVRYLGVSDHSGNRLVEARVIAAQLGLTPLVAVQSHYNLVHRFTYEGTLARVAASQHLGVMPRFALAGGFLTGKYRSRADLGRLDPSGTGRTAAAARHLGRHGLRVLAGLDRVAEQHGTSVATIALAWLLTKPGVVAPVASASSPAQVDDLALAAQVQLTRHQVAELDRVSQ